MGGKAGIFRPILLLIPLLVTSPLSVVAADVPDSPLIVQRLLGDLKQTDWILQASAMRQLADMKCAEAVTPILEILQTCSNEWMQGQALISLARIKPQEVPPRAGALVGSPHAEARMLGLRALEFSRQPAGLAAVRAAASDTNSLVRWSALAGQAAIEGASAWGAIESALKSVPAPEESAAVREIVRALAYVGSAAALERIDPLLERSRAAGRVQALIRGLADVHDPQLIPHLIHVQQVMQDDAACAKLCQQALARYASAELAAAVSAIFKSAAAGDLQAAAKTAGALCPGPELGECIDAGIAQRADVDPAVLRACLDALSVAGMAPSRHQALYRKALLSPDPKIRQAAVRCLEKCEDANLFELLGPSLRDESADVRRAALAAIATVPPHRAPPDVAAYLDEFLRSQNRELYEQGLKVLAACAGPEQLTNVLNVLRGDLGGAQAERRAAASRAMAGFCSMNQMFEIARPQGFVVDWMLLGAFPSDEANAGFRKKLPPEEELDFSRTYTTQYAWTGEGAQQGELLEREIKWQRTSLVLADGMLSLTYLMPPAKYGICYAVADVRSEKAQTVPATVAVDNCAAVWLNGRELARLEPAGPADKDVVSREVQMPLVAGVNRIMVKVANLGEEWSVGVRFHDGQGAAIVLPSAFPAELGGAKP